MDKNRIYKLATESLDVNFWHRGESVKKKIGVEDVDPEQLTMGIEVEMEHTDSKEIAEKIALDHLAENRRYYDYLKSMESKAEKADIKPRK